MTALLTLATVLTLAAPAPSYATSLAEGWAALEAQRFDEAVVHYTAATELLPSSEDAWIGLQRAHLGRRAWREAAAAGAQALTLNPDNVWAHRFQALARYQLGDYARARDHYRRVLALEPDDALMQLGLGFTLIQLGERERGRALCEQAGRALPAEPRVAECLALRDPHAVVGGASVSATYVGSPTRLATVAALTAQASARWSSGLTLWGGATLSRTSRRGVRWDQVTPLLGVGVLRPSWELWAAGALVLGNDDDADGAGVVLAGAAWRGDVVAVGASAAVSVYPDLTAVQLDPWLSLRLHDRVRLTLGGEVQDVDGELLGSGRASLALDLSAHVTLSGGGWYGARRYAVDAGGLSIWSSADRFRAGWSASLAWRPSDVVTLSLTYQHSLGDDAEDLPPSHWFELIGGTLGAAFTF